MPAEDQPCKQALLKIRPHHLLKRPFSPLEWSWYPWKSAEHRGLFLDFISYWSTCLMLIPYYIDHCSLVVTSEIRKYGSSRFISCDLVLIFMSLVIPNASQDQLFHFFSALIKNLYDLSFSQYGRSVLRESIWGQVFKEKMEKAPWPFMISP